MKRGNAGLFTLLAVIIVLSLVVDLFSLNVLYNIAESKGISLKGSLATMAFQQCVDYYKSVMNNYIEDEIELRVAPLFKEIGKYTNLINYAKREIQLLKEQKARLDPVKDATEIYMINEWIKAYEARIKLFESYVQKLNAKIWAETAEIGTEAKAQFEKDVSAYCSGSTSISSSSSGMPSYSEISSTPSSSQLNSTPPSSGGGSSSSSYSYTSSSYA